jgi:hypothetical protein
MEKATHPPPFLSLPKKGTLMRHKQFSEEVILFIYLFIYLLPN